MKIFVVLTVLACILCGCSVQTFETLGAVPLEPAVQPTPAQVSVELPQDAAQEVIQGQEDMLYSCDGYTILIKTLAGGDMDATIQTLSGYEKDRLTILNSSSGEARRYDWVWTAASEDGDMIGRGAVLDDGNFHYCLCVLAQAQDAGSLAEQWNDLFGSFCLDA